ncbi:hypothetical protein PTKIN_Ptkin18bG0028300 [Pterospermum kingtungense]
MSGVAKPKFEILDPTKENYLSWYVDIQLHLQSEALKDTLTKTEKDAPKAKEEATAMILILQHLHQTLKNQFMLGSRRFQIWNGVKAGSVTDEPFCCLKLNMIGNI